MRTTYKVASWVNLSGSVNVLEKRNNVTEVNNLQHNRLYGGSATFEPNDRISLELGYDYSDDFSQILVCFVSTVAPAGIAKCPGSTVLSQDLSVYTNKSHYGYFDVMWKPVRRLTTHLGYNVTSATGSALFLNPNAPSGPLDSNYHRPYGGLRLRDRQQVDGQGLLGLLRLSRRPESGRAGFICSAKFPG